MVSNADGTGQDRTAGGYPGGCYRPRQKTDDLDLALNPLVLDGIVRCRRLYAHRPIRTKRFVPAQA